MLSHANTHTHITEGMLDKDMPHLCEPQHAATRIRPIIAYQIILKLEYVCNYHIMYILFFCYLIVQNGMLMRNATVVCLIQELIIWPQKL